MLILKDGSGASRMEAVLTSDSSAQHKPEGGCNMCAVFVFFSFFYMHTEFF